ncbi:peptidase domain-containing ABC transporter [Anaeromyxobacter terrae]|uniref:peptidase domain-containing ABC transporter n=1 Tax=Anaeromyxobacter terrae TaxID=2925406 RepID=UPI001F56F7B4|nr:peptidase domain-containing ABC transporter [Anaeromyxobacter sp. SG22]
MKLPFGRRVRFVPQIEVTECGAACLSMILGHYGHHAPLAEVRQACGISRDGADALALVRAAREYGLTVQGVRVEMDQLAQLALPAILHWDFDHFLVLERLTSTHAVLVDPAIGRRSIRLDELGRHFTGVALMLSPSPSLERRARTRPSLGKYREIFRSSLPSLGQILLASLGLQVVGLLFPVATQILVDAVVVPHQPAWLWGLAFALGAAVLTKALLALVRSFVVQGLRNVLDFTLMTRFLGHLLHLPLGFFMQREAGDLVQRVHSNSAIQNLLGSQSISALLDGLLLVGYAGLMIAFDWRLGLVIIGFGALRVVLLLVFRGRSQLAMASELTSAGREFGALLEAISGLETTKASGAESRMIQRWSHRMTGRVNGALERRRLGIHARQATVLLQGLGTALVFMVGGEQVVAQRMTLGTFASFLALQGMFMSPLESLLETVSQLQYLGNHLERLDDVLTTPAEPSGSEDPGRLRGAVDLEDVSFGFSPAGPPTLLDISVRIRPGEKVAIVGPSGAGKSTLARLLLGMHLPSSGTIAFDGRDLRMLDLQKVRAQMGVVLQETFLFDDTIRANLSLTDEELPLERLRTAARLACVDDVIEGLPHGFGTRLGDNGSVLSGGQRQRLNLARALVHDPAILLLDEATSALDLETERRVHDSLASVGCTRILIAHRLATVKDADRILVLQAGRIVQEGTYDELSRRDGLFRSLVEAREFADA